MLPALRVRGGKAKASVYIGVPFSRRRPGSPCSIKNRRVSPRLPLGASDRGTLIGAVRLLLPYIWPADRADLKLRVVLALVLMIVSKGVTIAIPYSFKWATDAVAHSRSPLDIPLPSWAAGAIGLTVIYGFLRMAMALTQQGRDALFASVAMNGVRRLAVEVFVHLHDLSLRFHLERKTGGLTRVLERGRTAIETLVRTTMLTAVPTIVEFALVVGSVLDLV